MVYNKINSSQPLYNSKETGDIVILFLLYRILLWLMVLLTNISNTDLQALFEEITEPTVEAMKIIPSDDVILPYQLKDYREIFELDNEVDVMSDDPVINKEEKVVEATENATIVSQDEMVSLTEPSFMMQPVTPSIEERIVGRSWKKGSPVSLNQLTYIQVTHWGFDDELHKGEMLVHKSVAAELLEIFQILYEAKYPIERMELIDNFDANDDASMEANNSSSFCFRQMTNGGTLSKHSYGLAIDINPFMNPYISGNYIAPKGSERYIDRDQVRQGMIIKGDVLYNAFIERGWIWGGDWETPKDYQHFEKPLPQIE